MLCSKCFKKIKDGEEVQIKCSIICEKCASNSMGKKEVIDRCHGCFKLIHKDEINHEVYENWGAENSEKLIKCQPCYEEWLEIAKLKRKIWESARWFENSLPLNMWLVLFIITINKNKEYAGWGPVLLALGLVISNFLLSPFFLNFISFIYRKVLERSYRNKKRKLK